MVLCNEFQFDAAHSLPNYKGKCKNLHGHTYKIRVCVKGHVNEEGFVIDFSELKNIVTKKVLDILDHTYLNDIIKQPTAENTAIWIWVQLKDSLPLHEIWVWETPTSFVIFRGEK
ncbi:MAG: 6-carboxytetrahydropterin synthase QueD [Nanoarchaeota archaeon]|nr:6-carboxytetrahydropterin synthase QueD [Nanoarchaeota archaeon]